MFFFLFEHFFDSIELLFIDLCGINFLMPIEFRNVLSHFFVTLNQVLILFLLFKDLGFKFRYRFFLVPEEFGELIELLCELLFIVVGVSPHFFDFLLLVLNDIFELFVLIS